MQAVLDIVHWPRFVLSLKFSGALQTTFAAKLLPPSPLFHLQSEQGAVNKEVRITG
jgi:hypothetical protein